MYSARAFHMVTVLVRLWWLQGFQINGQYALNDSARTDLLRYCTDYFAAKFERQTRGCLHLHVLAWRQPLVRCIAAPQSAAGFEEEVD